MRHWSDQRVAGTAGAELARPHPDGRAGDGPSRVVVDAAEAGPGDLLIDVAGGSGADALRTGAWGVMVTPEVAQEAIDAGGGAVLVSETPVPALGALARAWRRDLAAHVIGIVGADKDLIAALVAPHRTVASNPPGWTNEVGLPLAILAAPIGTQVIVLELDGDIAELAAISEPDVGVVAGVEGGALLEHLYDGATAVVPSDQPQLEPWLREQLQLVTFGPGGDVSFEGSSLRGGTVPDALPSSHVIVANGERIELELPFGDLRAVLAAVAAVRAIGITPGGRVSPLGGERVLLGMGATVVNDCYNADPLSMRAALDDLAAHETAGRRVAILGDMPALGPGEEDHHRDLGAYAATAGVDVLVTVGPRAARMLEAFDGEGYAVADAGEAAAMAGELLAPGDVLLVKGAPDTGLDVVAASLAAESEGGRPDPEDDR